MRKNDSFTYFNFLILCMWPKVINKVKVIHQGQRHIKVKVSTSLQILCSPYSLQAGGLHSTEMLLVLSLCSVDFHTFTLQLPIQTPHSVALELQVFVSSLENCQISAKRAHPRGLNSFIFMLFLQKRCKIISTPTSGVGAPREILDPPLVVHLFSPFKRVDLFTVINFCFNRCCLR